MVHTELDVYYIIMYFLRIRVHVISFIKTGYINNNRKTSDIHTVCLDDFKNLNKVNHS